MKVVFPDPAMPMQMIAAGGDAIVGGEGMMEITDGWSSEI